MIKVGIVGVGNCASSFVQGVEFYRENQTETVGLARPNIGGYKVADIRPTVGFDVHPDKVGTDLSKSIWAGPNNAASIWNVPNLDAPVLPGPTLDGADGLRDVFRPLDADLGAGERVVEAMKECDVIVNWLPVGSTTATRWYADAALEANCAFVNAIPVPLAATPEWHHKYFEAGLPLLGDDIKSQIGATIVHRVLAQLFKDRGGSLDRTYQLNVGGNADFLNMHTDESRLVDKRASKQGAVTSIVELADGDVHIGPSDYVPFLRDQKVAFIRLEGRNFGGQKVEIEMRLAVEDSPNSAGIVVDAVRIAQVALDRGEGGAAPLWSAPLFKSPPMQFTDDNAQRILDEWIQQ